MFQNSDLIHVYSTKNAVEDGFLVKVDQKICSEAGIKFPVYLSRAVWDRYVEVPPSLQGEQDLQGRIWDILFLFSINARKTQGNFLQFRFSCRFSKTSTWEPNEKRTSVTDITRLVTLKATVQAQDFDDPSPAIFILQPHED